MEERNLFNRKMKNERLENRSFFKLHYFPEIPITSSPEKGEGAGQSGRFRPIDFTKDGGPYGGLFDRSSRNRKYSGNLGGNPSEPEGQAYGKGYTEGKKEGIKTERKKIESLLNILHQVVVELRDIRTVLYRNAEKETVNLALAIAEKIVRHEIAINKDVVLSIVKEALKKIIDYEKIIIRVSPSDYQFLKTQRHQFLHLVENNETMTFEKDETILSGGCLIETSLGDIDARIEKQLETVEETLKSQFQRSGLE